MRLPQNYYENTLNHNESASRSCWECLKTMMRIPPNDDENSSNYYANTVTSGAVKRESTTTHCNAYSSLRISIVGIERGICVFIDCVETICMVISWRQDCQQTPCISIGIPTSLVLGVYYLPFDKLKSSHDCLLHWQTRVCQTNRIVPNRTTSQTTKCRFP